MANGQCDESKATDIAFRCIAELVTQIKCIETLWLKFTISCIDLPKDEIPENQLMHFTLVITSQKIYPTLLHPELG